MAGGYPCCCGGAPGSCVCAHCENNGPAELCVVFSGVTEGSADPGCCSNNFNGFFRLPCVTAFENAPGCTLSTICVGGGAIPVGSDYEGSTSPCTHLGVNSRDLCFWECINHPETTEEVPPGPNC